jgi:hypothetical protein
MFKQIINKWIYDSPSLHSPSLPNNAARLGIRHGLRSLLPVSLSLSSEQFRRQIKNILPWFEDEQFRLSIRHGLRALLPINPGLINEDFRRQVKNIAPIIG